MRKKGWWCETLNMSLEHTLPAHQLLENFYNGFPSCLIGYLNLRNSPIDSSFDSLRAVYDDDLRDGSLLVEEANMGNTPR